MLHKLVTRINRASIHKNKKLRLATLRVSRFLFTSYIQIHVQLRSFVFRALLANSCVQHINAHVQQMYIYSFSCSCMYNINITRYCTALSQSRTVSVHMHGKDVRSQVRCYTLLYGPVHNLHVLYRSSNLHLVLQVIVQHLFVIHFFQVSQSVMMLFL